MPVESGKKEINRLLKLPRIRPVQVTRRIDQIVVKKTIVGTRFIASVAMLVSSVPRASVAWLVSIYTHLQRAGEQGKAFVKILVREDGRALVVDVGGSRGCEGGALKDGGGDAARLQLLVEGGRGKKGFWWDTGAFEGVALFVTRVGEHQRGDNFVNQWFVVVPFVDAALPNVEASVNAGDVRGGGRWKLRGQFGDDALLREGLERAIFAGVAFKEAPAKGIDEEQHYPVEARGKTCKNVGGQGVLAFAGQEVGDTGGDVGEAVRVIEGPHKVGGQSCAM